MHFLLFDGVNLFVLIMLVVDIFFLDRLGILLRIGIAFENALFCLNGWLKLTIISISDQFLVVFLIQIQFFDSLID